MSYLELRVHNIEDSIRQIFVGEIFGEERMGRGYRFFSIFTETIPNTDTRKDNAQA